MKHLLLAMSMLLFGGAAYSETTTLNINPTTGAITTPDVIITDLAAANVQATHFGTDLSLILVSTSNRTWLNISNQWYVLPKTNFTIIIDEDGNPQVPTGAVVSAGPYTAEPILVFEQVNLTEGFGSHYRLIIIGGKWHVQKLPHRK